MEKDLVQLLPFWDKLTNSEKEFVISYSTVTEYEKGRIIHSDDDKCLGMILILSGEIRTYVLSPEGREITLFRLYEKNSCVLSASCVIKEVNFSSQMIAEKDTKILVINAGAFSRLAEKNIYVKCYMYETLANKFSNVMMTMQQILFKGFDRRLADFLLSEIERTNSNTIKMTHQQIAQHTNSAREVVARKLKRFENDRIVELHRGAIIVKDKNALENI